MELHTSIIKEIKALILQSREQELFKKLNDFIWEFRTLYGNKVYRLFHFGTEPVEKTLWLWLCTAS